MKWTDGSEVGVENLAQYCHCEECNDEAILFSVGPASCRSFRETGETPVPPIEIASGYALAMTFLWRFASSSGAKETIHYAKKFPPLFTSLRALWYWFLASGMASQVKRDTRSPATPLVSRPRPI